MQTALCLRRGLLTPHPGVCSWGPCYLRILKGSKAQGNCKARVFPSAEEGKCSDQSCFLREGGASSAAVGTDCSPTDSGLEKKKKACSCIYRACCCLLRCVTTQPGSLPRLSLFLRLVPGHVTWPHGTADLTTRFLLFPQLLGSSRSAFFLLTLCPPSSPPSPSPEFLFFLFHIHQSGKHHLLIVFYDSDLASPLQ